MINPEGKANWRPQSDLGRSYASLLTNSLVELYQPKDQLDAIAYVAEMALPEIVAYDGHAVQAEMIKETAADKFPHLFGELPEPDLPTEPVTFFDAYTRLDGQINWNQVAKHTKYAISHTPISSPKELTPSV